MPPRPSRLQPPRSKPLVVAVLGSRGAGKTTWLQRQAGFTGAKRLLVWDYMREYAAHGQVVESLGQAIGAMKGRAWRIVYQPTVERREQEFDLLCKAARLAGNCTLVAEELAFVTRPNQAPAAWRELCLLGRHANVSIYGTSQRPASMDKDFLAMADLIHCGRLSYEPDAKAVAPFLGADWRSLATLADLAYIERRAGEAAPTQGVLKIFSSVARHEKPALRRVA